MKKLLFTKEKFYLKKYHNLVFHKDDLNEITSIQLANTIPYASVLSGVYVPYEITFAERKEGKLQMKGERIRRFDFTTKKFIDESIVGDSLNICIDNMNSFALIHSEGQKRTIYYSSNEMLWQENYENKYQRTLSRYDMLWTDTAIIRHPRIDEPYILKCIHPATKEQLWEVDLSSYGRKHPTFHKDRVGKKIDYLNYYQDTILTTIGGTLIAIDRYTGEILWSRDKSGRKNNILIYNQSILSFGGFSFNELNILTGELRRSKELNDLKQFDAKRFGSTWRIHDNKIFVKEPNKLIIAILDYKTLKLLDIYKEEDIQLEDGNYIERFDSFEVHDNKIFMTATTYKAKQMTCIYEYE